LLNRYGQVRNSETYSFNFEKLTMDQCHNLEDYINKKTTAWKHWKKYSQVKEDWENTDHFKNTFIRGLDVKNMSLAAKLEHLDISGIIEKLRETASKQDRITALINAQKEYSGSSYKAIKGSSQVSVAGTPKENKRKSRGRSRNRSPKAKVQRTHTGEVICWNVLKTGDCKFKDKCRFEASHSEANERYRRGERMPTSGEKSKRGPSTGRSKSRFRTDENIDCKNHPGAKHDARRCPDAECYYCGAKGHMSMVCQKQYCKTCGKNGHSAQGHEWHAKNP
jgi:hypothetical protein